MIAVKKMIKVLHAKGFKAEVVYENTCGLYKIDGSYTTLIKFVDKVDMAKQIMVRLYKSFGIKFDENEMIELIKEVA